MSNEDKTQSSPRLKGVLSLSLSLQREEEGRGGSGREAEQSKHQAAEATGGGSPGGLATPEAIDGVPQPQFVPGTN